jgi:nucleoside-triphosphatase
MGRALLLTGRPGLGKTTVIRRIVDQLGRRAGGFYTEEIREGGRRTGFRLLALDGPEGILASVNISGPDRVGKYGVHRADLDRVGVAALERAIEQPGVRVVVVDEIGKMEISSPAFRAAVLLALESPKPVLGTVMAGAHPWVDAIKRRPDVTVVELTRANREALPQEALQWLQGGPEDQTGAMYFNSLS